MNRQTPEQIVQLLHDVDEELGKGKAIEDICREKEISPATCARKSCQRLYCQPDPAPCKH